MQNFGVLFKQTPVQFAGTADTVNTRSGLVSIYLREYAAFRTPYEEICHTVRLRIHSFLPSFQLWPQFEAITFSRTIMFSFQY